MVAKATLSNVDTGALIANLSLFGGWFSQGAQHYAEGVAAFLRREQIGYDLNDFLDIHFVASSA